VAERSGLRDIATTDIYESIVAAVPAGEWGDYGRLWAWRSMAGLSGAPAGVSAEEVERQVRQSTWFRLEAYADWFHNDIDADYGIAALSPDCRRIAVPAATDTDWRYNRTGALPRTRSAPTGLKETATGLRRGGRPGRTADVPAGVQAANDQGLDSGWTKPRASVAEGASGGVVGENWPGIAASGAGPNEGGALPRPEEDPPAPGGSVHVPGISTRAWPVPVPVPVPVRLRRTR
jgi:hypothetical protein